VQQALTSGNVADAALTVKGSLRELDLDGLQRLHRTVSKARVAEHGGNGEELARLEMSVAIDARRRLPADALQAEELPDATRRIAPADFPAEASLPPLLHPRHKPLKPGEQYVSRVVAMPEVLARKTTFEDAAGERFKVSALRPSAHKPREQIGTGLRLASMGRTAAAVVRCSDEDGSLPRCTAPAPRDEQILTSIVIASFCAELDDDQQMASCRKAAGKCDLDHDKALESDAEIACLRKLTGKPPQPSR
jgi:hypothetical protein